MTEQPTLPPESQPGNPAPTPAPAAVDPPAAAAPVKPEGLDDRFFDAKEGVKFGDLVKEFGALSQFKSEAEAKAAEAEAAKITDPAAYNLEFADGMLPEGFQIDPDAPEWKVARETAIANGWSQETFSKASAAMIGIINAREQAMGKQFEALAKAEAEKMGSNAAQRVDAVTQWINANWSPETAQILANAGVLNMSSVIADMTKVMQSLSSAGVSSLAANGRVAAGAVPSDWGSMTFDQRMEFARQKQQAARA